jgi:hypothetical protein
VQRIDDGEELGLALGGERTHLPLEQRRYAIEVS